MVTILMSMYLEVTTYCLEISPLDAINQYNVIVLTYIAKNASMFILFI